jgi:serine/threonine protein kinase
MMLSDCSALTESLSGHHLLEDAALSETVRDLAPRFEDPKELAAELVRRGWLTDFQKELILAGRAEELVLGKYVLIEKIGEGGMGAVYKARHRVLKAVRAIKVIRPDRLAGAGAVERFYREAEVVAKLQHPNIILAHDADKHGNVHYFVMEFAPGADLGQLLQRCGPLEAADACAYIRQAALGLEHARERGLIHRDIKPSNLLVTPDGQVKLLDLGLARICAAEEELPSSVPLTQDGAVMGTPDYMAPEQAEDSRRVDIRADIYSLGCTFYHVLSGRPPYPGGSVMEKLLKHRLEDPRPIEALRGDLPAGLGAVIRKMMAKNPEARYQTPAEVATALEPFSGGAGRTGLTLPAELAGTLLPGMIPALPGRPTVLPGGPLEHTTAGESTGDSAPTATAYVPRLRGSTERLPREMGGLQPTLLPLAGAPGMASTQGESSGLQATQMLQEGVPGSLQTMPLTPARPRRGALIAALVLLGLGAGAAGAFFLLPLLSPSRTDSEKQRAEVQPVTPPATNSSKDTRSTAADAVKDKTDEKVQPQPKSPVVDTAPPGPPPKAVARGLTGDRNDLASLRTRGPAVRTGGRGLSWARRRDLYNLAPHKGMRATFSSDVNRALFGTQSDGWVNCTLREIQPASFGALSDLTNNLTDGSAHITAVGLSPDGNRMLLATVGRSERPLDGNPVTTKFNMLASMDATGQPELVYGPRIELSAAFGCLAFAPDGKEVLVGGALAQIYRWRPGSTDLHTGRRYFKHGTGDVVTALAYSSDSRRVASAGMDKFVCVFDATKSEGAPLTTLGGLHSVVLSVALSERARYVLAGGREGRACVWDVGDEPAATIPKPLQVLEWHDKDSTVKAVAFAPTGKYFVTGSDDGTVCLGEVGKDKPLWTEAPRGGGGILSLAVSGDGRTVLVADEAGLGEYPLVQDVLVKAKPALVGADAEVAPAEARGP